MSGMIERVARAMCRKWLEMDYEGENVDHLVEREWSGWAPTARAAIAAMREMNGAMLSAGCRAPWVESIAGVHGIYVAMIDAALAEETP